MAIGDDGNLYTWGSNGDGQLGNGEAGYDKSEMALYECKPQKIELATGVKPVKISAGVWYSMAIGNDGNLYVWGSNSCGQLGNGESGLFCHESKPQKIELAKGVKPVEISAGPDHSMAIGDDGNLYVWGNNYCGQLGNGEGGYNAPEEESYESKPQKIELATGVKPVKISAGVWYSMAIGNDGNLYSWGWNFSLPCGAGTSVSEDRIESKPQKIELTKGVKPLQISTNMNLFMVIGDDNNVYGKGFIGYDNVNNCFVYESKMQKIELGKEVKPVEISVGEFYSIAIGDDGNLYTWGSNSCGQLGNGYKYEEMKHATTPQKIILNTYKSENETKSEPKISYRTHVQTQGWQNYVSSGQTSGTTGKSLRLEAIKIKTSDSNLNIEYSAHVQNIGWQDFVSNDDLAGTTGKSLRLEAIKIRLSGTDADKYDIYYRTHAQSFGWLGWAKNGEPAGTAGYSYRLEAIEIKLVAKGSAAPGSTDNCYKDKNAPVVQYSSHVQNIGWQGYKSDGQTSGTSGKSLRLEAIRIKLSNCTGNIQYSTHIQNIGWQNFVSNNKMSGTSGECLRLEAIKIKLTGDVANKYDIYYRVHAQNFGWLGWAKNGEPAGTAGYAYRLEAIQIKLVTKGEKINGSTSNCFKQK